MHEHSTGEQSFPVLSTNGHGRKKVARAALSKYWFVLAIVLLATITIVGAVVGIMTRRHSLVEEYFSPEQVSAGVAATYTSYIIIDHGSILVSREHPVTSIYDTNSACSRLT